MKVKVMSVFGTRPEAIKMCPLVKELEKHPEIESVVCLTGQHREMLQQVIDVFGTTVKYNLDIMQPRQTLTTITTKVLERLEPVLKEEQPDIVLVHGDTSTSFVAALAAFYQQIPVGHVEAGLRTFATPSTAASPRCRSSSSGCRPRGRSSSSAANCRSPTRTSNGSTRSASRCS